MESKENMATKTEESSDILMKPRYIDLRTDFGFKKLFGTDANKNILRNFLQALIEPKGKIKKIRYLNSAQLGRSEEDRKAVFDIYCRTDNGESFIVEMQKAWQKYFKDRSVFYATFPIQEQAKTGNWDFKLNPVYAIGILNFTLDNPKETPADSTEKVLIKDINEYAYYVQLSDIKKKEVFYDKLTFIYLELPRFKKKESELVSDVDKWMYVLKNLAKLQDRPQALQERVFKKLFKLAEIEQLPQEERKEYERSLMQFRDMDNVINSAVEKSVEEKEIIINEQKKTIKEKDETIKEKDETIKETVNNLSKVGFSPEKISEITGITDINYINELLK